VNGIHYHPAYSGEIIALYDRLIDANGKLIGFQVWPVASATPGLFGMLPRTSYLHSSPESHFNILIASVPISEAAGAGDQSLVGQVYVSDSGDLAVAMDLGALSLAPEDLRTIAADIVSERTNTVAQSAAGPVAECARGRQIPDSRPMTFDPGQPGTPQPPTRCANSC
jgi:hypothetical protein